MDRREPAGLSVEFVGDCGPRDAAIASGIRRSLVKTAKAIFGVRTTGDFRPRRAAQILRSGRRRATAARAPVGLSVELVGYG